MCSRLPNLPRLSVVIFLQNNRKRRSFSGNIQRVRKPLCYPYIWRGCRHLSEKLPDISRPQFPLSLLEISRVDGDVGAPDGASVNFQSRVSTISLNGCYGVPITIFENERVCNIFNEVTLLGFVLFSQFPHNKSICLSSLQTIFSSILPSISKCLTTTELKKPINQP
jgi:hypothetical protein